jgi:hypothetical protein
MFVERPAFRMVSGGGASVVAHEFNSLYYPTADPNRDSDGEIHVKCVSVGGWGRHRCDRSFNNGRRRCERSISEKFATDIEFAPRRSTGWSLSDADYSSKFQFVWAQRRCDFGHSGGRPLEVVPIWRISKFPREQFGYYVSWESETRSKARGCG